MSSAPKTGQEPKAAKQKEASKSAGTLDLLGRINQKESIDVKCFRFIHNY